MALIEVVRSSPPALGYCKAAGCRRRIEWVETAAGKRMPVNHPLMVEKVYDRESRPPITVIDSTQSHFVTCPAAPRFQTKARPRARRR